MDELAILHKGPEVFFFFVSFLFFSFRLLPRGRRERKKGGEGKEKYEECLGCRFDFLCLIGFYCCLFTWDLSLFFFFLFCGYTSAVLLLSGAF